MIEDLRQGATRARFLGRATSTVAACAILAITVRTATAASAPRALTVKAPFIVKNATGQAMFQVAAKGGPGIADLFDGEGKTLVALQPNESGASGEVTVAGVKSGDIVRLSSYGGAESLRFYTSDNLQGGIGASANGGILQLNDKTGKIMAKVANNGTSGMVGIYNTGENTKGLLGTDTASGDAEFDLFYAAGATPAVKLSEVAAGGYFALTNHAGRRSALLLRWRQVSTPR